MKRYIGLWLMVALLAGGAATVVAQAGGDGVTPPPKVLVVYREFVKPGKSGAPHQKTESAFVQAMTAAKWPTHYLGMDSMSGQPRASSLPHTTRLLHGRKTTRQSRRTLPCQQPWTVPPLPTATCSLRPMARCLPIARTIACART